MHFFKMELMVSVWACDSGIASRSAPKRCKPANRGAVHCRIPCTHCKQSLHVT